MRSSKKYAGCLWAQKCTSAGVASGPIFKMGNAYPLTLNMSINTFDQNSALCDSAGQIIETRNEIDTVGGEMTLYQYGATEIGWAVGADPVAMTGTIETLAAAAVDAPEAGEWIETGNKNLSSFVLTDEPGTKIYEVMKDYLVNLSLGMWTPVAGGLIIKAAKLKWSGATAVPTGFKLEVGSKMQNFIRITGVLKDIKSGSQANVLLKCVSLTSKNGFTMISEPKTEYEAMSFDLKLITPDGHSSPATIEGLTAE